VTGILPVNKGGTGTTTVDGAKALLGVTRANLVDLIYPVGSIYMSVNSTSPRTLFGGTWEQIEDRFLLAAGSSYTAGDTGGSATVTLTEEQIPAHKHEQNSVVTGTYSGWTETTLEKYSTFVPSTSDFYTNEELKTRVAWVTANTSTRTAGGDKSHNNMPPYLVVFIWKRIA
jgi:hypothetical protein